jgi:hypothetical protein
LAGQETGSADQPSTATAFTAKHFLFFLVAGRSSRHEPVLTLEQQLAMWFGIAAEVVPSGQERRFTICSCAQKKGHGRNHGR